MPHAVQVANPEEQTLHVFDLPQLYKRPTAEELLCTLQSLALQAPSWNRNDDRNSLKRTFTPDGVPKYLTSIIASGLKWIRCDDAKEAIWEQASLRLAERSGRTAMPAMTRAFKIPAGTTHFEFAIHEPSLTGDSLGFKTWAASYLLSKRLHELELPSTVGQGLRILELGSGTGLVGMAAAAALGAHVLLTDLPEIENNLAKNVLHNKATVTRSGGSARTAVLDWSQPGSILTTASSIGEDAELDLAQFPVILAADSIYSAEHPAMLVKAITTWLLHNVDTRVVVELPCREGYDAERNDFKCRMMAAGLIVLDEGTESGYDDWGSEEDLQEVTCWWWIWGWKMT